MNPAKRFEKRLNQYMKLAEPAELQRHLDCEGIRTRIIEYRIDGKVAARVEISDSWYTKVSRYFKLLMAEKPELGLFHPSVLLLVFHLGDGDLEQVRDWIDSSKVTYQGFVDDRSGRANGNVDSWH